MDKLLKQFSDDVAKNLKAKIESAEFASFIAKVKDSGDDRTFEVVMSTSDEDRQGDALDQSGWDFKYFDENPVLLWAHNYQSFPIGIITDIEIQGDKTVATGKFAPSGMNPEADLACALYQEKILRAVSPGYIQNDDGTRELLEVSFCPVPAGRHALSLRQVRSLGLSTRDLITKGFFTETKTQQVGDHCQVEDGTPGVLAEDAKNPGTLICVPVEDKSQAMNEALTKSLKAEHERHGTAITKAIDEFKATEIGKEKTEGSDNSEMEKAIDEFETKMADEHADHLGKCMKAVDEAYEMDPEQKKSIDEFKKSVEDEHLNHVKCFDKAIDEFKSAIGGDPEKCEKAIEEFRTKAETELTRHEQAHMDMCKAEFGEGQDDGKNQKQKGAVAEELQEDEVMQQKYKKIDNAYSVFYAFVSAYMDEKVAVGDYDKLLDEAVALMKNTETKSYPASTIRPLIGKAGRTISAATKTKIEAVMKAIEEYHAGHTTDHEQFTQKAIAALKELTSSPQGDEGQDNRDQKSGTPKPRSSSSGAAINKEAPMSELESYLFTQRLLRQAKSALDEGLRQNKEKLKEKFPSRR